MGQVSVYCGSCAMLLEESPGLTDEQRLPCPARGSQLRHITMDIHETIAIRERFAVRVKEKGEKKPTLEEVQGDDLSRKTGEWLKKKRIIDRKNNRYREVITNPRTGQVIHQCEEPLSQHCGHGSAKRD